MKKKVFILWIFGLLFSNAFATDAQTLLNDNGCMACHNIRGQKEAPAFMGVAGRNIRFEGTNAKANIINSIKNGSKGKYINFQNTQMPPYPNLSESDLNTIADYILSLNQNRCRGRSNGGGMGMGRSMR